MSLLKSVVGKLLGRKASPEQAFAEDVMAELARHGAGKVTFDEATFSIEIEHGDGTQGRVGLLNMFNASLDQPAEGRVSMISSLVATALARPVGFDALEEIAERLMPLVRSRAELSAFDLENCIAERTEIPTSHLAWRPLAGDLVVQLGIDTETSVQRLWTRDLERIGVPFETALQIALANFTRKGAPFEPVPDGAIVFLHAMGLPDYNSSLLLLPPSTYRDELTFRGPPMALVSARHQFILVDSHDVEAVAMLARIASGSIDGLPHPCSTLLFVHDGRSWHPFEPEPGSEIAALCAHTAQMTALRDYSRQTSMLELWHKTRLRDAFAASFQMYERDGGLFSMTSWTKGVTDGLIPKADVIGFVYEQAGDFEVVQVAWDEAAPVIMKYLEEVQWLYPPRYRYRTFPTAEEIEALRARALQRGG